MEFERTQPEQPEQELVRAAYECTMAMTEKMAEKESEGDSIVAIAVPPDLTNQFRQKFELYAKYNECFKSIERYVLENIIISDKEYLSIDIPTSLHYLLMERVNDEWDFDSRLEVFENLRSYIENKAGTPKFLEKMSNKCLRPVNHLILLDADTEEEGYVLWVEIHFGPKEVEQKVN
ncbi:hypothetical protein LCGC14_0629780 [marine sediment metagenome]|uniref:Uncharacterized protein n=1 Tax=marine sediment metagenome TaxID=412755 RepID=A0A0F9RLR0_9ZZZZ